MSNPPSPTNAAINVGTHAVAASGLLDPLATWRGLSAAQQERIGVAAMVHALGMLGEADGMEPAQGWAAADIEGMQALAEGVRESIAPSGILLCHRPTLTAINVHACRRCGCTQQCACPGGCGWQEEDLCTACAEAEDELVARLGEAGYDTAIRPSGFVLITAPAAGAWDGTLIFPSDSWEQALITLRAVVSEDEADDDDDGAALDARLGDLVGASPHTVPTAVALASVALAERQAAAAGCARPAGGRRRPASRRRRWR